MQYSAHIRMFILFSVIVSGDQSTKKKTRALLINKKSLSVFFKHFFFKFYCLKVFHHKTFENIILNSLKTSSRL